MKAITTLTLVTIFFAAACSQEAPAAGDLPRGPEGAADGFTSFDPTLSCADQCGDAVVARGEDGVGYCFCSADCIEWGDCCADFVPSCQEDACEGTGGDWMDGACLCALDPSQSHMIWDDQRGCIAGPNQELCEATDGLWEDGECWCANDGATAYREYDNDEGCVNPDWIEIASYADYGVELESFVDPNAGFYLIDRPGAFDNARHFDSYAAMLDAEPWLTEVLASPSCRPVEEAVGFDCDQGFHAEGCFVTPSDATPVSNAYDAFEQYLELDVDDLEQARAETLESLIDFELVVTGQNLTLYFGEINGEMRLIVIDVAAFDCSA